MDQFRSFKSFVAKIDKYGMKSGIVKVIPPKEWSVTIFNFRLLCQAQMLILHRRDSLPALDEQVKTIKVKNPITQEFHGTHGTYTQANIEKQRSYNLPQWKTLTDESNHQPPARRGERRRALDRTTKAAAAKPKASQADTSTTPGEVPKKRRPGRPRVRPLPTTTHKQPVKSIEDADPSTTQVPPTPVSPSIRPTKVKKENQSDDDQKIKTKGKAGQAKSVASRRQYNRRAQVEEIDEESFKGFDYRMHNQSDWTPERCRELETAYWKSLNFNNPMYGADMPGSLFDDSTESWNVAKLENLLDVLGQKVPGVNTTYLYLGMWKATFAWHLEDVDLYSINYIHFGAPKQWYSISQKDARRFEAAMRNIWSTDAKNCDQFLRHKTYLISPQLLQSQYNIEVNRLVHYEGEFVITFPYGYHSGYNLGYNCAESVNFATESWIDFGKVAQKCHCEADSVWVDVHTIERKLRGEPTPEYYEETDDDDDDDDGDDGDATNLPTPPGSVKGKPKRAYRKRKRDPNEKDAKPKVKKLRLRVKSPAHEPCVLCPSDNKFEKLLPTDNGKEAHWRCALYTPETYITEHDGEEKIRDVGAIDKARLELKCNFCRSKRGAVFQCSQKKCTRAYHATCAAPAGVQVDIGTVPVWGPDGTEYTDTGIDFRCRFHRVRRPKHMDAKKLDDLEESPLIRKTAQSLPVGELVQVQYYQGDIFAGNVLENRKSEQTLLVETIPGKEHVEIEYKWLLVLDPSNSQLQRPSPHAKPLPPELAHNSRTTADHPDREKPELDKPFCDGHNQYIWSEFHSCQEIRNPYQVKIDLERSKQTWFYLGPQSTEAKAYYTADPSRKVHDPAGNFLETVRLADLETARINAQRQPVAAPYSKGPNIHALNAVRAASYGHPANLSKQQPPIPKERPYTGKYAIIDPAEKYKHKPGVNVDTQALQNQRSFQRASSGTYSQQMNASQPFKAPSAQMSPVAQMTPTNRAVPTAPMSSMPRPYGSQSGSASAKSPLAIDGRSAASPTSSSSTRPSSGNATIYSVDNAGSSTIGGPSPPESSGDDTTQWKPPSLRYKEKEQSSTTTAVPIAKMTGSSTEPSLPLPPMSDGMARPPALRSPSSRDSSTFSPMDSLISKYSYLAQCKKQRPPFYKSPYAPEGTYISPWSSQTALKDDSSTEAVKRPSLSEEYLSNCSPEKQELIKTELKAEKALRERSNSLKKAKESWAKYTEKYQPNLSSAGMNDTRTSVTGASKANGHGIDHWQSTAPMTTHYSGDERPSSSKATASTGTGSATVLNTTTAAPARKYNYIPPPSSSLSYSDFKASTTPSSSSSYSKDQQPLFIYTWRVYCYCSSSFFFLYIIHISLQPATLNLYYLTIILRPTFLCPTSSHTASSSSTTTRQQDGIPTK